MLQSMVGVRMGAIACLGAGVLAAATARADIRYWDGGSNDIAAAGDGISAEAVAAVSTVRQHVGCLRQLGR